MFRVISCNKMNNGLSNSVTPFVVKVAAGPRRPPDNFSLSALGSSGLSSIGSLLVSADADADADRKKSLLSPLRLGIPSIRFCGLRMAIPEGQTGNAWIEKVKNEGAIPCLELGNCPNGWATPPGDIFMVRGPDYLSDKVKSPGGEHLLKPLGFDWIKGSAKICRVLSNPNHRVRSALDEAINRGEMPFVWAFNLQFPSKDNYSAVAYFVALEPIQDGSLLDQFIKGNDTFRNSRLKLIANVVQGPWIVRTAVGEQAICILGRALTCKYVLGLNFIEVDVDLGSSVVANAIVHLAFGYVSTLTVDLAFLIESQTREELPERLLGAVRFSALNPDSADQYEMPSGETSSNMQSSLPTRLWKTLGQGFSHLLHQGNQDGTISEKVNGTDNFEDCTDNFEDRNVSKEVNGSCRHEGGNGHTSKW